MERGPFTELKTGIRKHLSPSPVLLRILPQREMLEVCVLLLGVDIGAGHTAWPSLSMALCQISTVPSFCPRESHGAQPGL